MLMGS